MSMFNTPEMNRALTDAIKMMREIVHAMAPPYEKPHDYMNIDYPITALKYEPEPGQESMVSRVRALRHTLYLLDQAESYSTTDVFAAFGFLNQASGVLVLCGCSPESTNLLPKAA